MDSLQRYQKRLRDEVAAVEKEIKSHNQQVAALNLGSVWMLVEKAKGVII